MSSSASFAPSIVRLRRGSGQLPMRSCVELVYKLAVASAGQTTSIFDLRRVVDVVAKHCMMEDRVDHCSS